MTIVIKDINLSLNLHSLKYSGTNKKIIAYSSLCKFKIYVNFSKKLYGNIIVNCNSTNLNISVNNLPDIIIQPKIISGKLLCNPCIFGNKKGRVKKIDNIILKPSLYYSYNNINYITKTKTTLMGKLVTFTQKLGKFTKREVISTDNDFWLSYYVVKQLQKLINKNSIVTLYFDNGFYCDAKFDILNNPLLATPIFTGSDKFYIELKVLI